MVQTTNSILDASLYDLVTPKALFAWQRVRLANNLATNGQEWYEVVASHNSGTYNNQYMVLNLNSLQQGQGISDSQESLQIQDTGLLWVVEQIPGLVYGEDVTSYLNLGYWPSYNVPFFPEIYIRSGYPKIDKVGGVPIGTEYKMAPRAKIFRRDHNNVLNLEGIEYILRYNDYVNDPLADGNPMNAICSRGDLKSENPSAGGCYDTKVTSFKLLFPSDEQREQEEENNLSKLINAERKKNFIHRAKIVNGPTAQNLPPFKWTSDWDQYSHIDLPYMYDFSFELVEH